MLKLCKFFVLGLMFFQLPEMQANCKECLIFNERILEIEKDEMVLDSVEIVLQGKIVDKNNQAILGAVVELKRNGVAFAETISDEEGNYRLPSKIDNYKDLLLFVSYPGYQIVGFTINDSIAKVFMNISMKVQKNVNPEEYIIRSINVPMLGKDNIGTTTFYGWQIDRMP